MDFNRTLILEDGQEYFGYGFGAEEEKVCELVFNTSMVGYQEILSDPSYTYQAIVMSYPLITCQIDKGFRQQESTYYRYFNFKRKRT